MLGLTVPDKPLVAADDVIEPMRLAPRSKASPLQGKA
jgi:hypothetical protein